MSDPVLDRLNAALADRYRILRELGQGGMATVYLAHDLRHDRQVAVKVLRPELAAVVGAERFLAEIRTTANLQHPYILPLHDSGEADSFLFYVMPYVRGESLRERLDREKQLAVGEAVTLAGQIADALDYAHEQGVVHRDVKPGNVLLSERGDPLVADFGIALAVSQAGGGRITETGLSMGTPHYMSPEQATGDRDVDPRSDVYALGCVLYEMLAGQPPFAAPTAQAVLARILTEEARDVREVRKTVPPHVAAVLSRALEKLPADRFESAGEFRERLGDEGYRYEPSGVAPGRGVPGGRARARRGRGRGSRPWALAAAGVVGLVVGALAVGALAGPAPDLPGTGTTVRAPLDLPIPAFGAFEGTFDISPDGSRVVFTTDPSAPLEVIELDGPTRRVLPGTENSMSPIFSPDGRWITFGRGARLMRVGLDGGGPVGLVEASVALPTAWGEDGSIYYGTPGGAYRLPEGGEPERILDRGFTTVFHFHPVEGRSAVLYTERTPGSASAGGASVHLLDLETGETKLLVEQAFDARHLPTGHLVYGRTDGSVMAVSFDSETGEVTGLPRVVMDSVRFSMAGATLALAIARNGSAAYLRGGGESRRESDRVAFVDGDGGMELPPVEPGLIGYPAVSPDGRTLVYQRDTGIHLFDLVTYGDRPLVTPGSVAAIHPVWAPDGSSLAYAAWGEEQTLAQPVVRPVEPGGEARVFPVERTFAVPSNWVPDGSGFMTVAIGGEGLEDWDLVWIDAASGDVTPYLESRHNEYNGMISPDGRWVAYISDETGRAEVYVRAFPEPGPAVRVAGGAVTPGEAQAPQWSPDGGTIYFPTPDSIMATRVDGSEESFVVGETRAFLPLDTERGRLADQFTIHPDGRIVTVLQPSLAPPERRAGEGVRDGPTGYLVVNWIGEMLRRLEGL